jgi:rhodanese-related sulfurtransferase
MASKSAPAVSPGEVRRMLQDGGEIAFLDVREEGVFSDTARTSLGRVPRHPLLVLTSPDGVLARLAAAEIDPSEFAWVRVLESGTHAWRAAGLPLVGGREAMADEPNDCWRRPYDPYADAGARQRYLDWEIGLLRQIAREGDVGFRIPG